MKCLLGCFIFFCVPLFLFFSCSSHKYLKHRPSSYAKKSAHIKVRLYGCASYYGKPFHGRLTANGERYNMYALTAAHKLLPFNTRVKVTNLSNLKSVVVRINDRGPFIKNRIIDLSYGAAQKIGMIKQGTVTVKLQILD